MSKPMKLLSFFALLAAMHRPWPLTSQIESRLEKPCASCRKRLTLASPGCAVHLTRRSLSELDGLDA